MISRRRRKVPLPMLQVVTRHTSKPAAGTMATSQCSRPPATTSSSSIYHRAHLLDLPVPPAALVSIRQRDEKAYLIELRSELDNALQILVCIAYSGSNSPMDLEMSLSQSRDLYNIHNYTGTSRGLRRSASRTLIVSVHIQSIVDRSRSEIQ